MNDIYMNYGFVAISSSGLTLLASLFLLNKSGKSLVSLIKKISIARGDLESLSLKIKKNKKINKTLLLENKSVIDLKGKDDQLKISIDKSKALLKKLSSKINDKKVSIELKDKLIKELSKKISIYEDLDDGIDIGFYETPDYMYDISDKYKDKLKDVRNQQKELIKTKDALFYPDISEVTGFKNIDKKIFENQYKLILSYFNIECDSIISKVSVSNYDRCLERIGKLANDSEKYSSTYEIYFNVEYVKLKLEECILCYEYKLKKHDEQNEQKLIKERIKEEQRVLKEIEKAEKEAQKEEDLYRKILAKTKEEVEKSSEDNLNQLNLKIKEMEEKLKEAQNNKIRAKSMAEQTKRGHVYIISNIGSFGENIYKIGMTRRLDPLDRVKELGDASVPFPFDVHAIIYSEDAPAMEAELHRIFNDKRVNAINHRKEFFKVDLWDIKNAVDNISGHDSDFKMTALAEDFNESRKLAKN